MGLGLSLNLGLVTRDEIDVLLKNTPLRLEDFTQRKN